MAYKNNTSNKAYYKRHIEFLKYRTIEQLWDESNGGQCRTISALMPKPGTTRGTDFAFTKNYDLPDAPVVVCSGAVALFGGHTTSTGASDPTGGYYIGVSMRDAAEYDRVEWMIEGKVMLQLDGGDAEAGRVAASEKLEGKDAYWLSEEGVLTDIVPNGGVDYLHVGRFASDREIQPDDIPWGIAFAVVDLQPIKQASVGTPAEKATGIVDVSTSCEVQMFPQVVGGGLTVDFHANAYSSNPNLNITEVYWNFTGTQTTAGTYDRQGSGQVVTHTYASAGTYTVTVQAHAGSDCVEERQFQVTVTASGTPVITAVVDTLTNARILNMPRPKVMSSQVLADTINVQLNHNSIICDNGGNVPEIVREIGDSWSETHFDASIDSVTWTTDVGTFQDTGTTSSTLANPVLSVPTADDIVTVSCAINANTLNGAGTSTTVFGLEIANGELHRQFLPIPGIADATADTEFDFSNESIHVNVTPASFRFRYDLAGTPVTDATETGNHDYSSTGTYTNDYSQEWSGNGAIGTYYTQFTLEVI